LYASSTGATPGLVLHVAKRALLNSEFNGVSLTKPLQSGSIAHFYYERFCGTELRVISVTFGGMPSPAAIHALGAFYNPS